LSPANIFTSIRLLLIPVFAVTAWNYGISVESGHAHEPLRYLAVTLFLIIAAGDAVDGYLARKFGKTRLGAMLDPLADKVLMLVSLVILSQVRWGADGWIIPVWFVVMVVLRDVSISLGCLFIIWSGKKLEVNTNWMGKASTAAQLITLGWVMLKIIPLTPLIPTVVAATLTLWSSWFYVREAWRQLQPE